MATERGATEMDYTCLTNNKCAGTLLLEQPAEWRVRLNAWARLEDAKPLLWQIKQAEGSLVEKADKRMRKGVQRFAAGEGLGRLLLVTLTTPDDYTGGLHRAWRLFLWRLRNKGLKREYFAVREWNNLHTCEHLHVVMRTDKALDCEVIRDCWLKALRVAHSEVEINWTEGGELESATWEHKSVWTHHRWVWSEAGCRNYLCKYLVKAFAETPWKRSYWYSQGWVFPGYVGFSTATWLLGKPIHVVEVMNIRAKTNIGWAQFCHLLALELEQRRVGLLSPERVRVELNKALKRAKIGGMRYGRDFDFRPRERVHVLR